MLIKNKSQNSLIAKFKIKDNDVDHYISIDPESDLDTGVVFEHKVASFSLYQCIALDSALVDKLEYDGVFFRVTEKWIDYNKMS